MGKAAKLRSRRKRRLSKMRLRTRKKINLHTSKSGRTGKIRQNYLKGKHAEKE